MRIHIFLLNKMRGFRSASSWLAVISPVIRRTTKCGSCSIVVRTVLSSFRTYSFHSSSFEGNTVSSDVAIARVNGKFRAFKREIAGMSPLFYAYLCENVSTYVRNVLSIKVQSVSKGRLSTTVAFNSSFIGNTTPAVIHGGVTASIIDHVGGFGAWTVLPRSGLMLSTVDLRVEYLAPLPFGNGEEVIVCEAEVVNQSEKLVIADIYCWNKDKTILFATGRGLYNIYTFKNDKIQQYGSKFTNFLFRIPFTDGVLGKALMKYVAKTFYKKHKLKYKKNMLLSSQSSSNYSSHKDDKNNNFLLTAADHIVCWDKTAKDYADFVENYTPFGRDTLGIKVQHASKGELTCVMPYKSKFLGNFRQPCLHGGVPAALVDQCGGFCARSVLDHPSKHLSTVELTMDYIAPLPCFESIICEAKVVSHIQDKIITTDVTCWNESRTKLLVFARVLFNVYIPKKN